jgi:archaellum component FlaC
MPSHDSKKSAAELRKELKELRKEHVKPVSKMRMGDISSEIQKLRSMREETPAVDSVPSAPVRKLKAAAETIKEAKRSEFPVAPADSGAAAKKAVKPSAVPEKKKNSKLDKLMKMLEEMSDSGEE